MGLFFIAYFMFINSFAMYLMYVDKQKSIKKEWRIPESNLLVLAICGGFLGTYCGMKYFRHKTQHWQFHAVVILSAFIWLLALPAFYLYLQV